MINQVVCVDININRARLVQNLLKLFVLLSDQNPSSTVLITNLPFPTSCPSLSPTTSCLSYSVGLSLVSLLLHN